MPVWGVMGEFLVTVQSGRQELNLKLGFLPLTTKVFFPNIALVKIIDLIYFFLMFCSRQPRNVRRCFKQIPDFCLKAKV